MHDPDHRLRVTLESIRDAVVFTDAQGRILSLNSQAQSLTGWLAGEVIGKPIEAIVNLREYGTDDALPNPVYAALESRTIVRTASHTLLVGRDGRRLGVHLAATPLESATGSLEGVLLVFYDASEALRLAERMAYLAQHDALTGLPNRILLVDRLENATRISDRTRDSLAVAFVDLDDFHTINETYGHVIADQLLKEVGHRLCEALRESDTVCRLGGDEFVLLMQGVKSLDNISALTDKLLLEIAAPYSIGQHTIHSACSIGISVYPRDASDAETLMRMADGAMHKAKKQGRGCCVFASGNPQFGDEQDISIDGNSAENFFQS